jgi:hypothetical protein
MVKNIILITLLLINCSCLKGFRLKSPLDDYKEDLKNASPDSRQGWYDGCETGIQSGTNAFYQSLFKTKQDGYKMVYSPDYSNAWGNAYWYCYRKEWTNIQSSTTWSSVFGGLR